MTDRLRDPGDASHLLQPLTAALLECVAPAEVVSVVVERGIAALGARAGLVALVTRDGQELEIVRTSGFASDLMDKWGRFSVNEPYPLSDAVRSSGAVYLEERSEWAAQYPILAEQIEDFSQASVSLPLTARQHIFGAMHFSFGEARVFTKADRNFLDELARQCALALERALLLEEVQNERRDAEAARAIAEAARSRLEFLARASALLGDSLDYQSRLEALVRLCVPYLADWAGVDVLAEDGSLVRLAVAHRDPERESVMRDLQARYPPDPRRGASSLTVIENGTRLFYPDIPEHLIDQGAVDAEHARLLKLVGIRAALSVPLTTRSRTLGALSLGMGPEPEGSGRSFSDELVALAEELARRAAVAVDNARLYAQAQRDSAERREAEGRFQLMADSAPVLIWTSGLDALCDWFNQPWLTFTGRTMAQEAGNGWAEGVHPDDLDRCLRIYLDSFAARQPFTMEYRLRRADGEYRWLLDNGVPTFAQSHSANNEAFTGYIGSCIDITSIKEGQMERERLVTELREASQRQRRFLKEMLSGFTEGRLRLCDSPAELPAAYPPLSDVMELSASALRQLRKTIEVIMDGMAFPKERIADFLTAVHEAAMNAVRYGGGGTAHVHGNPGTGLLQVWVQDNGPGIAEDLIHRAVEQGWTTGGFGQGFFLMRSCADRLFLLTVPNGTTIVLEMERTPPRPAWLRSTKI